MMMKYILALASASLFLLCGCQHEDIQQTPQNGMFTIKFSRTGMTNGTADDTESQINTLNGYQFENGVLKETFSSLKVDTAGSCQLDIDPSQGSLYFLANGDQAVSPESLKEGVTTLEEFLKQQATAENMVSDYVLMTGKADLDTETTSASVALKRAVARIDLESPFQDAQVNSVTIRGVADRLHLRARCAPDTRKAGDNGLDKRFWRTAFPEWQDFPFLSSRTIHQRT